MKPYSKRAQKITASTTMRIDAQYKQMLAEGQDVVGFGAGETDFNTPEHVKKAGILAIQNNLTRYTAPAGTEELRKAIAAKLLRDRDLEYAPNEIVVSSGGKHMFYITLSCLLNPGDEVILPAPYWVSYKEQIEMCGGIAVIVDCDENRNFDLNADDIARAITPKTKAIIINSPSNPTGRMVSRNVLEKVAKLCVEHKIFAISDEIYDNLVYEGKFTSFATLSPQIKDLTILINGVSKSYAMTGWRIGYAACNRELATLMASYQSHSTSSPATMAQKAAVAALDGDQSCVEEVRQAFIQRRDVFLKKAAEISNIKIIPPQGAFYIMMSVEAFVGKTMYGKVINNADDFAELLLQRAGVAVVPCGGFGAPNYLRWGYATSTENIIKGLDRLKGFIDGK